MKNLSVVERWWLTRLLIKIVDNHTTLTEFFAELRKVSALRWNEDNQPSQRHFLVTAMFPEEGSFHDDEPLPELRAVPKDHRVVATVKPVKPEQTLKPYLITRSDILGELAGWAVRQSPYVTPDNMPEILTRYAAAIDSRLTERHQDFAAGWFYTEHELRSFLRAQFDVVPEMADWFKPKSYNGEQAFVVVSRYDKPKADNDCIDEDALARNVANALWKEAKEHHESCTDSDRPEPSQAIN